jgi:hypothetical protein
MDYWPLTHTPLGTRSNYSAIANLHTLQITTAPTNPFPACCALTSRSVVTVSNSGHSSASRTQVMLSQQPVQNSCQLLASLANLNWLVISSQLYRLAAISHQAPSLLFTGWPSTFSRLIAPTVLAISSRHELHTKHCSSIVACIFVSAGTCLRRGFLQTGCLTAFIKNPLPQQQASFRDRYPATGLHATIFKILMYSRTVLANH